jgi:2-dehydro-3-deoxyphosphooctonate aldolase (KDO 8-P synthase)
MNDRCTISGPNNAIEIGRSRPLAVIAGPCVIEERSTVFEIARTLRDACAELGLPLIFKASYDKANRTSVASHRGPGLDSGLQMLREVRAEFGVPITTDVHSPEQAESAAEVVDILQIPAFLCRQTDLLVAAATAAGARGRAVNVKKGQFLAPDEMAGPVGKLVSAGCSNIMLTERGTFFGYHRLVTDFIGLGDLMEAKFPLEGGRTISPPVCFDCTHSAQLPGLGATTGGRRDRVPLLARAAVAAGVHAVFLECHPNPERARSDASTMLPLGEVPGLLRQLCALRSAMGEAR